MESKKEKRLEISEFIKMIPVWCIEGALVKVDKVDKDEIGIIIEYCLIDPLEMPEKEYHHMIENNEWLHIWVCTQTVITDYYLDEITPII